MKKVLTFILFLLSATVCWPHGDIHRDADPLQKRFTDDSKKSVDERFQQSLREQLPWQQFLQQHGNWWVQFNETNAKPHRAFGTPIQLQIAASPAAKGLYFLNAYLSAYLPASVQLEFLSAPVSKKYVQPNYIQKYNGLEVLWSRATVKMTPDNKVVMFGLDVYDDIAISTTPVLNAAQAIAAASADVSGIANAYALPALKILPVPGYRGNTYHLVYEVHIQTNTEGDTPDDYYTLVDAMNGEILYRQDRIVSMLNTDITATGTVYTTHPYNTSTLINLPYLKITVGGNDYNTDVNGFLNLANTSPFNATFTLTGPWSSVYTGVSGTTLESFSTTVNPGNNVFSFDNNTTIRHLSAYYHVNVVHDFMKNYLPSFTGMDVSLETRIDRTDGTCNAFYNGNSINFYTTAGGCYALSMVADVIYHEYGHGISNTFWSDNGLTFSNGAMGEGYSDIWGISITNNPVLGIGFSDTDPNANVRNYDFANNVVRKVYPQDIIGEVHADGEIIAGAWWSTGLLLGSTAAMTSLFTESLFGLANGPNGSEGQVYTDILIDALQADDNDGNLSNGTPNIAAISQAFALHGITLLSNATLIHTPVLSAAAGANININAVLTNVLFAWSLTGVKGAYKINNSSTWTPMTLANTGGNNYSASIPAQPEGTLISYYLGIEDINGILSNVQPSGANNFSNPNIPYFTMIGFNKIFTDDFDNTSGFWTEGLPTDQATTGQWEQNIPDQTLVGTGVVQPNFQITPGGIACYVTGGQAGAGAGSNDVDDGATTLTSPTYDLTAYTNPTFEYYRWYSNDQGATPGTDFWQVYISNDGSTYIPVEYTNVADHSWRRFVFRVNDFLPSTSTFSVRFVAEDANAGSLVEALMDEFSLYDGPSTTSVLENESITALQAWPNPAHEALRINCTSKNAEIYQLSIFDAIGKLVFSQNVNLNSGNNQFDVPVAGLSDGMYQLRLTGKSGSRHLKFSVLH